MERYNQKNNLAIEEYIGGISMNLDTLYEKLNHSIKESNGIINAETTKLWMIMYTQLIYEAKRCDARDFLRWDIINKTLHLKNRAEADEWYKYLINLSNWKTKWEKVIKENSVGNPIVFNKDNRTSPQLVQHIFNLAYFEDMMSIDITDIDLVIEFGGGYGSVCRVFYNLNYDGKYFIYDLKPFSILQTLYLRDLGIDVINEQDEIWNQVWCASELGYMRKVLKAYMGRKILFIADWSLSETPLSLREKVFDILEDRCTYFHICYQHEFDNINNKEYFSKFQNRFKNIEWRDMEVPYHQGNSFLFGKTIKRDI